MKRIGKLVKMIDNELHSAEEYAEKYIEMKADGNSFSSKYKDLANDRLKDANILHEIAVSEITKLNQVFKPRADMQNKWNESHTAYVEKTNWISEMLSM